MFNCLKVNKNKRCLDLNVGDCFLVERKYLDSTKYYYLNALVISIDHPKYIVLEVKHPSISNHKYKETILKHEFTSILNNNILSF